ncbi:MAG: hypothetical protein ACFFD4_35155 [Candidatus Odinarchaeota archaeon]
MQISLSTAVIIFVTVFSLLTGLIVSDLSVKIDRTRDEISVHQFNADKIEEKSRFLKDSDREYYTEALNLFSEAAVLAVKYWAIEVNGPGLTTKELIEYQLDFAKKVWDANNLVATTVAVEVINNTFLDPNADECVLAEKTKDGYDYVIARNHWEFYKPVYIVSKQDFLVTCMGLGAILDNITYLTDAIDTYTDPAPYVFYRLDWDNINQLYEKPLWDEIEKQQNNEKRAGMYESQVDLLIRIIVVIIAALILATVSIRHVDSSKLENSSGNSATGYSSSTAKEKQISKSISLVMSDRDELARLGQFLVVIMTVLSLIAPVVLVILLQ